jgi:spore cortex biosynthesis protein YabQ
MITIYGGLLAGAAYDFYRLIRRIVKKGRWLTVLFDVLFIIAVGIIVLAAMYAANAGELRLFTFVGFALGFGLYMAGLSAFFHFVGSKIRQRIAKSKTQKKD